jgi:hypothetical protein
MAAKNTQETPEFPPKRWLSMLKVRAWRVVACGGWQTSMPKRNITIVCIFIIELTGYDHNVVMHKILLN